jgi:hypothetical protein
MGAMSFTTATVRKILRETLVGGQPLRVEPQQIVPLGQQIIETLRGQPMVHLDPYRSKDGLVCQFSLVGPGVKPYDHWKILNFKVHVDQDERLTISLWRESAAVSELGEIFSLVARCQDRLLRQQAQRVKQEKVKSLKSQAVIARVKQLAREEKFDFSTDTSPRFLKLYVKLSERECAELQVPFKDFEAAVPHLRGAIQSLRGFHACGMRFGLRQLSGYARRDWVRHESLS